MRYRRFGPLEWESSALGLGLMRLPESKRGTAEIDRNEAIRIIRFCIDHGVNYLDIGFPWDVARHTVVLGVIRDALSSGYRQKVKVAVSIPAVAVASAEGQCAADFDASLEGQLSLLGLDSADFCVVGRLTRDTWPAVLDSGVLDRLDSALADGRVGYAGFSFRDHYRVLKSVVQGYDRWTFCSVEYSYMDVDHNPGTSGLRYASEQGLAVVATAPFKGGRLSKVAPEDVRQRWAASPREWSPAEWALRFVLSDPSVSVVVAGMSSTEQASENVEVADGCEEESLSVADEVAVSRVRDALRARRLVRCPSCRPCMPCPQGIDIPRFIEIYNDALMYRDPETAFLLLEREGICPQACNQCRVCESRCAKRLPIADLLAAGRETLKYCGMARVTTTGGA
jgi:predicted aldo/keto reductase-like oxidoreductase